MNDTTSQPGKESTTEWTIEPQQRLDTTIGLLRDQLAAAVAHHDVYTAAHGRDSISACEYVGEARGLRAALFYLDAGSWDEIDAQAEQMWPAAIRRIIKILDLAIGKAAPENSAGLGAIRLCAAMLLDSGRPKSIRLVS